MEDSGPSAAAALLTFDDFPYFCLRIGEVVLVLLFLLERMFMFFQSRFVKSNTD